MPTAIEILTKLVQDSESCELEAYQCPAGVWTIGWGATGPGIVKGVVWTQAQTDSRLTKDCEKALIQALASSPTLKDQSIYKQAAIADFCYNLGVGKYQGSTLRKRVDEADWTGAKSELKRWVNGGGRVLNGLVKRRNKECDLVDKI